MTSEIDERKLNEKINSIVYNIGIDGDKLQKLAGKFSSSINPADLGDYVLEATEALPGYKSFWKKVGNLGGFPFSKREVRYLSHHPIEVFDFMERFESPIITCAVELAKAYD